MKFSEVLLAILTIVPSIGWFIAAFVNLYVFQKTHQAEIKKVAEESKEKVVKTAEQMKTKVESGADKLKEKIESHKKPKDDSEPPTEDSGTTH